MAEFLEKLICVNFFQNRDFVVYQKSKNWTNALVNFMTKNHWE